MKYNLDYPRDRASLLMDAADVIDQLGWTRWSLKNNLGVCAIGALLELGYQEARSPLQSNDDWWDTGRNLGLNGQALIDFNNGIANPGDVQFLFRWRAQEILDGR